ncbi:MAG TPA: type II toxin-antitoxin system HigB family toxin [Tepidisphaeraceae bacterium]|jgi:mRNA interferase HigB
MRVVNEPAIARFIQKHGDSRSWLENWLVVVRSASWQSIQDVRRTYSTVDGGVRVARGARVTVFNVSGNRYRLVAGVIYPIQTITVLELMTHGEYSRDRWKRRY